LQPDASTILNTGGGGHGVVIACELRPKNNLTLIEENWSERTPCAGLGDPREVTLRSQFRNLIVSRDAAKGRT
jgi:hypothetical protein